MPDRDHDPLGPEGAGEDDSRLDRSVFFESGKMVGSGVGTDVSVQAQQPETVRLLNYILGQGVELGASDIHFQPDSEGYLIRMRIDGVLSDFQRPPKEAGSILLARIKVLADLNIAERRLPQDGRLEIQHQGRDVEIRVSIIPAVFGESAVLRILSTGMTKHSMTNIGLSEEGRERFTELFQAPHGMILVTGPTGSGKTTTLYAVLNEINQMDRKIITTEEPVEYDIRGIIQVEINAAVGLTFASSLRSILRQDPDIILIGEIRDPETARIAIQAGLTGHLVLGTVHTRDACSAVPRLINMGIEPYLVADTILGIIAQRLIRRLCQRCKVPTEPSPLEAKVLADMGYTEVSGLCKPVGCEECSHTGFKGRQAIFEIVICDAAVRDLIHRDASPILLRDTVRKAGSKSLRQEGIDVALQGGTTLEEVFRITLDERVAILAADADVDLDGARA
jgi:type II secretory ATPase GspE/PulE/Tfp pilus assembly ATPase PilB-like protein